MADDFLAVADLIADALDLSDAEVSDLVNAANFFMRLPVELSSNGSTHKYAKETGAPVVGFRAPNAGRDHDHSTDTVVSVDLKMLDFSSMVDYGLAKTWRKGGAEALIAREIMRHLKSAFFELEKQIFQGTGNAAGGFAGFPDASNLDDSDDAQVINAAGTTADTGSSAYLIRLGPNAVSGVMQSDVTIDVGESIIQDVVDGTGKHYPAYYTPGTTWAALQVGGVYDVIRIANLTEDAGKGLTDDLIFSAIEAMPNGDPDIIVCSRRSRRQLRESRTATNVTGAPAPIPDEVGGIPVIISEGIPNTEALLTPAA